ncbi:leucine-rich repeat-containing protein 59-like protein [Dinothrombium tinctorium]|uniref:Leucine-rich repeat-containing protein 59-like protein n=1 Tax=Dinothrombium tinctorium TaxID=1965070 RepID=A0A3S3SJF9_9ACAR|nr:leucine-rich repeat-containing protein 59-like protein [Dinothrombium tinctorium]
MVGLSSKALRKHDYVLEGSHWDLSLLSITELPVAELDANRKATKVDLSNNFIRTIPPEFPKLVHLTWLDLSKNRIVELPENFGSLVKLQHLDLYSNKLERLPLSFGELKRLKWLDLKENPLNSELQKIVGDCRTAKECEQCALRVVKLMKEVSIRLDLERKRRKDEEEEAMKRQQLLDDKKRVEKAKKKAKLAKRKQREHQSKESHVSSSSSTSDKKEEVGDENNFKSGAKPSTNVARHIFSYISLAILFLLVLFLILIVYDGDKYAFVSKRIVSRLHESPVIKLGKELTELCYDLVKHYRQRWE